MEHVTRITLTNTNNSNKKEVYTLSPSEKVASLLMVNKWVDEGGGQFTKDRVIVTVEEIVLFVDIDRAIKELFF